jgi:hypothetical protein
MPTSPCPPSICRRAKRPPAHSCSPGLRTAFGFGPALALCGRGLAVPRGRRALGGGALLEDRGRLHVQAEAAELVEVLAAHLEGSLGRRPPRGGAAVGTSGAQCPPPTRGDIVVTEPASQVCTVCTCARGDGLLRPPDSLAAPMCTPAKGDRAGLRNHSKESTPPLPRYASPAPTSLRRRRLSARVGGQGVPCGGGGEAAPTPTPDVGWGPGPLAWGGRPCRCTARPPCG